MQEPFIRLLPLYLFVVGILLFSGCSGRELPSDNTSPTFENEELNRLIAQRDAFEDSIRRGIPPVRILYPFEDYYINLETMEKVIPKITPADNFKTLSPFSFRFSWPHWWKGYPDSVEYKGVVFRSLKNGDLKIGEKLIPSPGTSSNFSGHKVLVKYGDGVVYAKAVGEPEGYIVRKFDEKGEMIWEEPLAFPSTDGRPDYNVSKQQFYLATAGYLLFTCFGDAEGSTIIDVRNGNKGAYGFNIDGVIRGAGEDLINGYVTFVGPDQDSMRVNLLIYDWILGPEPAGYGNTAETLIYKDILVVATYTNIATGSQLAAYNLGDGKLRWKADVAQLNVGHSQYYNGVTLSRYRNKVMMEGSEAGGSYLQIFDLDSGERLFSSIEED